MISDKGVNFCPCQDPGAVDRGSQSERPQAVAFGSSAETWLKLAQIVEKRAKRT